MEKQLNHLLIIKNPDLEAIKKLCQDHRPFLDELVDNLTEKKETIRYNSVKVLTSIAEEKPELLYPYWEVFEDQLHSMNTFHILTGIILISRVISADRENHFKVIENDFFDLINHKNVIPVRYLLLDIWRIGKSRPEYIPRINEILFSIDGLNQEHKGLLKGDALLAFVELWDILDSGAKKKVTEFARGLLKSESPKTRKEANKFIRKFAEET
jgi:hypothetical protein